MDKKTTGAWLIHHGRKLMNTQCLEFDKISHASKAGSLLSAFSISEDSTLPIKEASEIAKAEGISPVTEFPTLLETLENARLIDLNQDRTEIRCLGLTTASVLTHTNDIYKQLNPSKEEEASLEIAETVSNSPRRKKFIRKYISDEYKLPEASANSLLNIIEEVGFIDYEPLDNEKKLYFNGNLFRKENAEKASKILESLKSEETQKVIELQSKLDEIVCIPYPEVIKSLGLDLFEKLQAIGMFDVNSISNEKESVQYISKPSAFYKFQDPLVDDALDLAKAFTTSLTYGMRQSPYGRGRIRSLPLLMGKLLRGQWVGPATAIGNDYQILELKRVIKVRREDNNLFSMKLLKKDVGKLAQTAIDEGDVTSISVPQLVGASILNYNRPETNREIIRKKQQNLSPESRRNIIDSLRTIK